MITGAFRAGAAMTSEQAEIIAINALGWLARDQELMGVFAGSTGADLSNLKYLAADSDFLGSVLDFILMDDATVTGFCDDSGLSYEIPMQARQHLSGGAQINWT